MSGPILDAIFFRQIKHANGVGKAPWSSICRPFLDQKKRESLTKGVDDGSAKRETCPLLGKG